MKRSRSESRPTYTLAARLFPRLLAVVYLIAFVSLWVQLDGLVGSGGILPRFTDRSAEEACWRRQERGLYLPAVEGERVVGMGR